MSNELNWKTRFSVVEWPKNKPGLCYGITHTFLCKFENTFEKHPTNPNKQILIAKGTVRLGRKLEKIDNCIELYSGSQKDCLKYFSNIASNLL